MGGIALDKYAGVVFARRCFSEGYGFYFSLEWAMLFDFYTFYLR